MISHEIRSPLNAILGWSQMLRQGALDKTATTNALESIERNAKVQAQLIEDILDVSRIIVGKMSLESRPLELAQIINAAIDKECHSTKQQKRGKCKKRRRHFHCIL